MVTISPYACLGPSREVEGVLARSLWTLSSLGCAEPAVEALPQVALLPCSLVTPTPGSIIIKQKEIKLSTQAEGRVFNVYALPAQICIFLPSWL